MKGKVMYILIGLLICSLIGNFFQYRVCQEYKSQKPKVEIVYLKDTITIANEVIKEKIKLKYLTEVDTIITHQIDSIILKDTIQIPISHYEYKDTIKKDNIEYSLNIQYSGYKASLDTIDIFTKSTYQVPMYYKTKKWTHGLNIGVGIGYGLGIGNNNILKTTPFIGVTVGYGLHRKF